MPQPKHLPVKCPQCLEVKGIFQEAINDIAYVDYYRCSDCHYLWSVDKSQYDQLCLPMNVRNN